MARGVREAPRRSSNYVSASPVWSERVPSTGAEEAFVLREGNEMVTRGRVRTRMQMGRPSARRDLDEADFAP